VYSPNSVDIAYEWKTADGFKPDNYLQGIVLFFFNHHLDQEGLICYELYKIQIITTSPAHTLPAACGILLGLLICTYSLPSLSLFFFFLSFFCTALCAGTLLVSA
jgi:hypothetical protein